MRTATALVIAMLTASSAEAQTPPTPAGSDARMVIARHKDIRGTIHKKLGLPDRAHCWSACLNEAQCTAARWGVLRGDTAGLCILLKGELHSAAVGDLKTDDGTPIEVTVARKVTGKESRPAPH